MIESKEKTDAEKHEEFEKQQAKDGVAIHLPRGPIKPDDAPDEGKKKPKE